ncbi:MAG: hypothetical protein VX000_02030, partial [Myxococcota bacterium]|nr:hypothetical protein [Myxococcota bacterium]
GVLIAASIVLGGDSDADADADVDLDGDIDADFDADAEGVLELSPTKDADLGNWLPFLSVRFWTFGLASFGLTGALLTVLGFGDGMAVPVSGGLGVTIGWLAALAFRSLRRANVSADTALRDVGGAEGEVLLAIGPGKRGKVRALIGGRWVDLLAETGDETLLARNEKILVVSVTDGVAQVTRLRQIAGGDA